jgi:hypothetical protein
MTKASHTPGPWAVNYNSYDEPYIIAEQGKAWDNPVICSLYEDVTPEDSITFSRWLQAYPNAEANARLIVAAPDLLFALENLLAVKNGEGGTVFDSDEIARAAIAKAKGT